MHALIGDEVGVGHGRYIDYFRRVGDAWKSCIGGWSPMSRIRVTMPTCTGGRAETTPTRATTA